MASKAAHKRLTKEYVAMQKEPPPFVWAVPDERNILTWNYIIRGPPDSPYAGGEYHGVLLFPSEYPFKPPGIKMYTPSGRFSPDKKICFSMSDFHPGTWNPAWSVATILTGLLSFMLSDEMTTGSVTSSDAHKRAFAAKSHAWNLTQKRFREAFPEHCQPTMVDLPNMGGQPSSSSSSSENTKTNPTPTSPVVAVAAVNAAGVPQSSSVPAPAPAPTQANGAAVVKTNNNDIARPPTTYWGQMMWEKWRWGVLILLAVVVSRISS